MNKFKPGLSVCMIVKDEENNITESVRSFLKFADEIIINDTGSTDKTRDVLSALKINEAGLSNTKYEWFGSDWRDDFSYSRNLSIDKAHYNWIIWLDADDRVPPESAEKLNQLKTAPLDRCFQFRIKNTLKGLPLGAQWMQLRMFPNRPDIRFEGAIHEQIGKSCYSAGLEKIAVDLEIYHTGYENEEMSIEKTRRNLRIMESSGYGNGDTEKCAIAAAHYRLEQWIKGIDIYKDVYQDILDNNRESPVKFQLPAMIGRGWYRMERYNTAIDYFNQADPTNIEAMYQKGQCYESLQEFETALECYLKVIDMPEVLFTQAQDYDFCKMHAFHLSWRIMVGLGRHKEALNTLNRMHEQYPRFKLE